MSAAPSYLIGLKAPVADEIDAVDLPVTGTLPAELTGRYLRNGPNPVPGGDGGHWFTGDGMVHGVRLRDGRAGWYRNRWVRTRKLAGHPFRTAHGVDLTAVNANTNVVRHADRILALVENGLPYQLTPDLGTVGPCDFGGRLGTAMTAHPKRDPATGELHFFGYGAVPPYLTYHRLSAAGELVESREIAVPGPTMMHDFAVTERHLVWLDLPVVFDPARLGRGMPYRWDDGYGARLGVMPRAGGPVRWHHADPCYVFHVGNAYDTADGRVALDGIRYSPASFTATWSGIGGAADPARAATGATWHRWLLDPGRDTAGERQLDDRPVEFPTLNETRVGRPHRYLYTVTADSIVKYDATTGAATTRRLDRSPGEAVHVPARGAGTEDAGWLLTITAGEDGSDLLVLDATTLDTTATVHLPRRVPRGFHGSWLPDRG